MGRASAKPNFCFIRLDFFPQPQLIHQKISQAALLREDYKKTQDDLEALKRSAQNIAEQVKDTTETVTGIAKEKLSEATQRQDASQPNETIKTIDTTAQSLPNEPPELPGNPN